jgi:flagellar basal body-associated protein FliL
MSDDAEDAPVKSKGGSKLVLIILVLNLLGVGALAAFVVLGQKTGAAHAAEPAEHAEPEAEAVGPILPLESLVVNLQGTSETPESSRYLKVTVQLEATSEETKGVVEKSLVPIRSRLLVLFSGLTLPNVVAPGAVASLQTRCKDIVNEVLGARRVKNVFFTEFVVQ